MTKRVRKDTVADKIRENHLWELGTCEPAELDEDGIPIEEADPTPIYDDDDHPNVTNMRALKSSLVSRFKGIFSSKDKSPQPPPPRDPTRPPHDLRDPVKVKTKEELAKDERRRRKRRKERSKARKRDDGFSEDEDLPPTPPTEPVEREPQGMVGQRPREGYPCDMTEGWRELRVYLSACEPEMNCALLSLPSLFRDLRPITDPRRIKVVPVLIPHPPAAGRGVGGGWGGVDGGARGRMGKDKEGGGGLEVGLGVFLWWVG